MLANLIRRLRDLGAFHDTDTRGSYVESQWPASAYTFTITLDASEARVFMRGLADDGSEDEELAIAFVGAKHADIVDALTGALAQVEQHLVRKETP